MNGNFNEADHLTAINEGGFTNDPQDHGGLTYAGIASTFWPKWGGWPYVRAAMAKFNNGATQADTHNINLELRGNPVVVQLVSGFYMANFWNVNLLSQVTDNQVADNLYDCGVNQGTGMAAHILQDSINILLGSGTVVSDGGIGPKTLQAQARCDQEKLYGTINDQRLVHYKRDKDWPIYGKVWTSRLKTYAKAA
jgi:lysozyme family protein